MLLRLSSSVRATTGLDRIRHLDVNNLWLQEQHVREIQRPPLTNTNGNEHPTDLMTKHLPVHVIQMHLTFRGLEFRYGRAGMVASLYGFDGSGSVGVEGLPPLVELTTDCPDGMPALHGIGGNERCGGRCVYMPAWDRWTARGSGNV